MSLLFLGSKIGCAYPLSAGSDEITGAGAQPMTISADGQTASWTTTSGGELYAVAAPSGFSTGSCAKLPFTSGTRVIEWQSILMPAGAGGGAATQAYTLTLALESVPLMSGGVWISLYVDKDGGKSVRVQTDTNGDGTYATQYENLSASSFPSRVSIYVDCGNESLIVLFDGTAVALTDDTFPAGQYVASIQAYQSSSLAAGDIGKVVGATLATSAADIGSSTPAGATDPCGNSISDRWLVDNDGYVLTDDFFTYLVDGA